MSAVWLVLMVLLAAATELILSHPPFTANREAMFGIAVLLLIFLCLMTRRKS